MAGWLAVFLALAIVYASGEDDVAIVQICQQDSVSLEKCQHNINREEAGVRILENFDHQGDWTILPLLVEVHKAIHQKKWIFFATEDTVVNIEELRNTLTKFDSDDAVFLGHALTDPEPTIIHHFSSNTLFKFPLLSSGVVFSRKLLERLVAKMEEKKTNEKPSEFSIDTSYELSLYIFENLNVTLTDVKDFCIAPSEGCDTHINVQCQKQFSQLDESHLVFAVKTCEKFHKERVKAVKDTWGARARNIFYFSDVTDKSIPTIRLDVTHTQHGHCDKSRGIIRFLRSQMKEKRDLKWAVITDDDTILSVKRVLDLINQHNFSEPLAIGERYGYNLQKSGGYNYLTGGGGVILSRAAIMNFQKNVCLCPSPSTPDDMFLFGVCLKKLGVTVVHTPLMHQARPNDYSKDYLSIGSPVSFHKHWMVSPYAVYQEWFQTHDQPIHSEL